MTIPRQLVAAIVDVVVIALCVVIAVPVGICFFAHRMLGGR